MTQGKFSESRVKDRVVHLGMNVSSSAQNCGCMVEILSIIRYYVYNKNSMIITIKGRH